MTKITDEKSHVHETEIWENTQGGKNRVVRVRKKNFCCCYEGKILELECKQLMEMNKGRDGWEIQERTKAAGDSLQWDLHPVLVKERCQNIERQNRASFLLSACSIHCFRWNLVWEWGREGTACLLPRSP